MHDSSDEVISYQLSENDVVVLKFSTFYHFAMMFKHIKHDIYGCEVSFEVELLLYFKLSFNIFRTL